MKSKRTKLYLQIDLICQLTIFLLAIYFMLIPNHGMIPFGLFYFGIGGLNIISFLFHLKRRLNTQSIPKIYTFFLVTAAVFGILSLVSTNILIAYMVLMIFAGLIMGISYLVITLIDLKEINHEK